MLDAVENAGVEGRVSSGYSRWQNKRGGETWVKCEGISEKSTLCDRIQWEDQKKELTIFKFNAKSLRLFKAA